MSVKYIAYKFTVSGSGHFPVDMLRYDRCCPATSLDVSKAFNDCEIPERRAVDLVAFTPASWKIEPTIDRWRSFGWIVLYPSIKRLE